MQLQNNIKNLLNSNNVKGFIAFCLNLYLLIFGLGWATIHLYFRLILKRPAYDLHLIKDYLTFKHYIIFVWFVLLHLGMFFIAIFILYKRNKPLNTSSILYLIGQKLNYVINTIYWQPLQYLHNKTARHIPGSGRFFLYVESIWRTKRGTRFVVAAFDIIPKLLVSIIFVIEVVIYNRILVFMSSLTLLLIPLGLQIFLKLFKSFALRNSPNFLAPYFETILGVGEPKLDSYGVIIGYEYFEIKVTPEYIGKESELKGEADESITTLLLLEHICLLADSTKLLLQQIYPYITLVTSSLYFLGGSYRLYVLFF